jgi:DNA-binding MarR family transcriptional regulator
MTTFYFKRLDEIAELNLPRREKAVLFAMHYYGRHGVACAGFSQYARHTGLSLRSVRRAFKTLAYEGLIQPEPAWWEKKIGGRGHKVAARILPN